MDLLLTDLYAWLTPLLKELGLLSDLASLPYNSLMLSFLDFAFDGLLMSLVDLTDTTCSLSGQSLRFDVNPEPLVMWPVEGIAGEFFFPRSSDDPSFSVEFDDKGYGGPLPASLPPIPFI